MEIEPKYPHVKVKLAGTLFSFIATVIYEMKKAGVANVECEKYWNDVSRSTSWSDVQEVTKKWITIT